jgi:hypothetical protein
LSSPSFSRTQAGQRRISNNSWLIIFTPFPGQQTAILPRLMT